VKLLALETSTDACSVALAINGEMLVDHRIAPQQHAQLLLPMIDKIVVDAGVRIADLDGVAFGCGPGSFTGVRSAAATTQGIAFGADIGVIPVSSLHAMAQGAYRTHASSHVFASFDARMGELYWGVYAIDAQDGSSSDERDGRDEILQPLQEDCVCSPHKVVLSNELDAKQWSLLGSGADQYRDVLSAAINTNELVNYIDNCWPSAQDVLRVAQPLASAGEFKPAAEALPVYLRDRVALTEAQRAAGDRL